MLSTAANMESVLYRCLVRAFCVFLPVAWKLHEVICPLQILSVLENSRKAGSENTLSEWLGSGTCWPSKVSGSFWACVWTAESTLVPCHRAIRGFLSWLPNRREAYAVCDHSLPRQAGAAAGAGPFPTLAQLPVIQASPEFRVAEGDRTGCWVARCCREQPEVALEALYC